MKLKFALERVSMSAEKTQHARNACKPFVEFQLEKVLGQSDRTKVMALLGRYEYETNINPCARHFGHDRFTVLV